jgi:hypothetical protein
MATTSTSVIPSAPNVSSVENPSNSIEDLCNQYLQTLTEKEYKAYLIAKSHLGTSFQLEKSNGFLKWKSIT